MALAGIMNHIMTLLGYDLMLSTRYFLLHISPFSTNPFVELL